MIDALPAHLTAADSWPLALAFLGALVGMVAYTRMGDTPESELRAIAVMAAGNATAVLSVIVIVASVMQHGYGRL